MYGYKNWKLSKHKNESEDSKRKIGLMLNVFRHSSETKVQSFNPTSSFSEASVKALMGFIVFWKSNSDLYGTLGHFQ